MAQITLPSGITIEYERRGSGEPGRLPKSAWRMDCACAAVKSGVQISAYDSSGAATGSRSGVAARGAAGSAARAPASARGAGANAAASGRRARR